MFQESIDELKSHLKDKIASFGVDIKWAAVLRRQITPERVLICIIDRSGNHNTPISVATTITLSPHNIRGQGVVPTGRVIHLELFKTSYHRKYLRLITDTTYPLTFSTQDFRAMRLLWHTLVTQGKFLSTRTIQQPIGGSSSGRSSLSPRKILEMKMSKVHLTTTVTELYNRCRRPEMGNQAGSDIDENEGGSEEDSGSEGEFV
ncbi:hypothetical protein F4604DRAFT_2045223 [Suillus subluteus]|nr:hypothetical protein F4604DRAFT_2003216 [Suillus subluteus]KAG1852482.1 hypothetical protein F4604DRAFT_2045223 [Suillus subluteus]